MLLALYWQALFAIKREYRHPYHQSRCFFVLALAGVCLAVVMVAAAWLVAAVLALVVVLRCYKLDLSALETSS